MKKSRQWKCGKVLVRFERSEIGSEHLLAILLLIPENYAGNRIVFFFRSAICEETGDYWISR